MANINTFKDLIELALFTYKITVNYPSEEKYVLVSQMRRAAVSVPSNIVEGFKRKTVKESLNFYNISAGSLEELKYQLLLSKDLGYLKENDYLEIFNLSEEVSKLLQAWSNSQKDNSDLA